MFRILLLLWQRGPHYPFSVTIFILSPSLLPSSHHFHKQHYYAIYQLGRKAIKYVVLALTKRSPELSICPSHAQCSWLLDQVPSQQDNESLHPQALPEFCPIDINGKPTAMTIMNDGSLHTITQVFPCPCVTLELSKSTVPPHHCSDWPLCLHLPL